MKYDIVYAQIGTPLSSNPDDIRSFLKKFLSSRRVVDVNPIIWKVILNLLILPKRPQKLAPRYQLMESTLGDNPTNLYSRGLIYHIQKYDTEEIKSYLCSALEEESVRLCKESLRPDAKRVIVPLFPQYSEATYDLIFDNLERELDATPIRSFQGRSSFIKHTSMQLGRHLAQHSIDTLLLSFHSYPVERIENGDSYYSECLQDFNDLKKVVKENFDINVELCFQSKFGKGEWLGPLIEEKIEELAAKGHKRLAVHCPAFLIDSIETTWEIGIDLKEEVAKKEVELLFIPSLNDNKEWAHDFSNEIKNKRLSN